MDRTRLVQRLTDLIYEAALGRTGWPEFVAELSEAYDGAAVMLTIDMPSDAVPREFHSVGLMEGYPETCVEHLFTGLPFRSRFSTHFVDRFASQGELFGELDLGQTDFYTEWLKPQGLAAVWPIGHTVTLHDGIPMGGVGVFRREGGGGPFGEADLELGNQLVPHLMRAFGFHGALDGVQHERLMLAEVVDRLPTGVILLDEARQPVIRNRSAERILALRDGIRVGPNGPYAENARENAALQELIADALEAEPGLEFEATGFMAVSRPSGERDFPVMVTPLLAAPFGAGARRAVVALFVSNPAARQVEAPAEVLEKLYSLTHAEAEVVRLISEGQSLEQAAQTRGISIHTARSHLKHAFAKTQTRRQGELVRLILTGVAPIREQ